MTTQLRRTATRRTAGSASGAAGTTKPTLLRRTAIPLTLLVAAASPPGHAQDEEGFSGQVAFGYLATSGNSDSETLNSSIDLWWNYAPWAHALAARTINASTSGVTTAEAYGLEWQTRYAVGETAYAVGLVAVDRDGFSSYDRQIRVSLGFGRRLIDRERHMLNGDVGLGARQADLRDFTPQDDTILRLAADYRWIIAETSEFSQTVVIDSGSENTYVEAESSLSADIYENLALVFSYTVRRNSQVLPDSGNMDAFTALSLEYSF